MTRPSHLIATCSAVAIAASDGVPEWVHLLPAGQIRTVDGRGPYTVPSMDGVIAASLPEGGKLAIDECHSTDRAAPLGMPAPARGWIVELQARADGLWGKVEWTGEGRRLMEDRAYAGISPVIAHLADKAKTVLRLERASLVNNPNLQGLVALHSEESVMNWKDKLIELLGLDSDADDAAILAALQAKVTAVAPQSANLLEHPTVIALQAENTALAGTVASLQESYSRDKATAYVDGEIKAGRVGLKPVRDEYIALHMQDASKAVTLIAAMPKISGGTIADDLPPEDGQRGIDAVGHQVIAAFGISEEDYKAGLASRGQKKEAL